MTKPILFVGSGISLPSFAKKGIGFATVQNLTEALFNRKWAQTTTNEWYEDTGALPERSGQPDCQEFLLRLRKHVEDYYFDLTGNPPTYEDLYFLVQQIHDEVGWRDNAAVSDFRATVSRLSSDLCDARPSYGVRPFQVLAGETLNFIENALSKLLAFTGEAVGLDIIKELASLSDDRPLVICTLNHDLLIENFLDKANIPYTDGFAKDHPDGICHFAHSELDRNDVRVKLLKLHGSINWWRFRPKGGKRDDDFLGIRVEPQHECRTKDGRLIDELDSGPSFLTGSDNKLKSYQAGVYLRQMRHFESALETHSAILVSGYGWGDSGMSIRLRNWVYEESDRKIILLHENPNKLRAGRHLMHWMCPMVKQRKLILVPKMDV